MKLFIAILLFTSVSFSQSWWWTWSDGVYIEPRSLNAEGDSFKINLTIPDFVSGDTLKLYYNGSLIETFYEDTTTVLGLTHNTQYCYELKRQTFQGLSAGSQACATTIDTTDLTPPDAIIDLLASGLSPSSVQLTWTKPEAGNISIWMKIFGSSDSSEVYFGNLETYTVNDLQPNTNYSFQGIFYDWNLNHSHSNIDTALTFNNSGTIAGGDNLNATTVGVTSIDLIWNRVTGGVGDTITYKVYGSLNAFTDSVLLTTQYNDTTYTHTGLERNTEWFYRVHSTDSMMNALVSNVDSATTDDDTTPPTVPNTLVATGVSTSQINLTWVNPDGAKGYIYRATSSGGTYNKIDSFSLGATSYSNSGLSSATAYWYKVSTYDEWYNESAQSDADSGLTFTPSGGELEVPQNLVVTGTSSNSNDLTWNTVTNADSYYVYGKSDRYLQYRYQWTKLAVTATNSYSHTGIPDGWEWEYYVQAKNDSDISGISATYSSYPLRSTGTSRYVSRYGNGATFSNSTPTNAMSFATLSANTNSLAAGDTVYFFADSVYAPSSTANGSGVFEPQNGLIDGTSLAYIVFAKYGAGADPIISSANVASRNAMDTYATSFHYVIFQNIEFIGGIMFRASNGHNKYVQFRDLTIRGTSNGGDRSGLYIYTNPETEPAPNTWTFEGNSRQYNIEIANCKFYNMTQEDAINKTGGIDAANSDTVRTYGQGDWVHHNEIYGAASDGIDWQGNGNTIEYNIVNNTGASGIKHTPHYNGAKYCIARGNIAINQGGAGDFSFSNHKFLRFYNNTSNYAGFNLFGNQGWNPPTSQRSDSNFVFNNILGGLEWDEVFIDLEFTHADASNTIFTDDSLYISNYYWHNMRIGGGYSYFDWYYRSGGTAVYNSGIYYTYSGQTTSRTQVGSDNIATLWANKTPYIKMDTIVAGGLTNTTIGDNETKDTILARLTPLSTSFAVGNAYDTTFTDYPYTEDILGNPYNNTIGAIEYNSCEVTDHFTYTALPYANNDFLVQRDGYKTISSSGHSAVTMYDSVALHVYKNGTLFMRDADVLSYNACDSTTFSVSINVPADTAEYTFRLYRNTTVLDSCSGIRIGNAYLVSGQSNAIQDITGYKDSILNNIGRSRWFETSVFGGFVNATETGTWDYQYVGTSWSILADSLIKKQGIPVLVINGAVGGSSIGQHLTGDAYYTSLRDRVQAVRQDVNGWTKVYWWQGETEGDCGSYATNFDELRGLWTANLGVDTLTIVQLGFNSCLYCEGGFYETQRSIADSYGDVDIIGVAGFVDFNADNCHLKYSEYKNIGTWLYRKGIYSGYDNPTVDSISYQSGVITVYFDQPITYIDSLAIDHDNYWWVDGDSLMVDTGYVANSTQVKLEVTGDPASVTTLGYLQTYQYFGGGYYRYPLIRNANRVGAILFGNLNIESYGAPDVQMPANFTATHSGIYDTVNFNATIFYRTVDFDSIRVNGSAGSYPANQWAGTSFYAGTDTAAIQNDNFVSTDLDSAETWYFRLWLRNTSTGLWSTSSKQDTAYFPGSGATGGSYVANLTFESNSETGTDAFTTVSDGSHSASVQDSVVYAGTYSWEIVTAASSTSIYGEKTFTAQGTTTLSFWLNMQDDFITGDGNYVGGDLAVIRSAGGTELAKLIIQEALFSPGGYHLNFYNQNTGDTVHLPTNFFSNWVHIEMTYIKDGVNGGATLTVGGIQRSFLGEATTEDATHIRLGMINNTDVLNVRRIRFDNITVE